MEKDTDIRKIAVLPVTCELKNIFHTCLQDMLKMYSAYKCATKIQPWPSLMPRNPLALLHDIEADVYLIRQVITAKCAAGCQ